MGLKAFCDVLPKNYKKISFYDLVAHLGGWRLNKGND